MSSPAPTVESAEHIDDSPDWNAVTEDVSCPRCEYNLRGLTTPRCPECGLKFSWTAVFEAAHNRRDWLFEHQWKKIFIRSFAKTAWRTLRPIRFWRTLQLTDQPNRPALRTMAAILILWACLAPFMAALIEWLIMQAVYSWQAPGSRMVPTGKDMYLFGEHVLWRTDGLKAILYFLLREPWFVPQMLMPLLILAMPAVYFLTILASTNIYRQTLGRCRIKSVHLMRISVYSCGPLLFWPVTCLAAMFVMEIGINGWVFGLPVLPGFNWAWFKLASTGLVVSPWLISLTSVILAMHSYLKLPRGWMVGSATVVIAVLVLFIILVPYIYTWIL